MKTTKMSERDEERGARDMGPTEAAVNRAVNATPLVTMLESDKLRPLSGDEAIARLRAAEETFAYIFNGWPKANFRRSCIEGGAAARHIRERLMMDGEKLLV